MAGASIIAVDDGVDTGPVIVQQRVSVEPGDTAQTLHTRIKQTERQLLWDVVVELSSGERTLPLQQK
jgi:Folate-dependent phosphoribosylglycinamide formyltransferase PurN